MGWSLGYCDIWLFERYSEVVFWVSERLSFCFRVGRSILVGNKVEEISGYYGVGISRIVFSFSF